MSASTPSSSNSSAAVFLSNAREDGKVVGRIAEALREAGLEVWFDQNELWAKMRRSPRFPELMKQNGWTEHYQTARATLEKMHLAAGRK